MLKNIHGLVDVRQTPEYAQYMQQNGWKIYSSDPYIYTKKIPFTPFKIAKALRYHRQNNTKTKDQNTIIFKDEPFVLVAGKPLLTSPLEKGRDYCSPSLKKWKSTLSSGRLEGDLSGTIYFKKHQNNSSPVLPTKTIWINLDQSLQLIKSNFKSKTRYNLKRTYIKFNLQTKILSGLDISNSPPQMRRGRPKAGVVDNQNSLLQQFYNLWSHNPPHNWIFRPKFNQLKSLVNSFGEKCFLVISTVKPQDKHFVEIKKQPIIAAALVLTTPNMAFYWHNASTHLGKQLFAPTRVVWEAIKESKRRKLQIFDFEGVWDERYPNLNKGWKGFTRFKEGFIKNISS
jgi:hypothetical protein